MEVFLLKGLFFTCVFQPTTVEKREPTENTTWTGIGFMLTPEGSDLTFEIPNVFRDLDYDLVVRHEHSGAFADKPWDKARAQLIYLDGPPAEGSK